MPARELAGQPALRLSALSEARARACFLIAVTTASAGALSATPPEGLELGLLQAGAASDRFPRTARCGPLDLYPWHQPGNRAFLNQKVSNLDTTDP